MYWQVLDCINCYFNQKERGSGNGVKNPLDDTVSPPLYGWTRHNPNKRRGYVELDPLLGAMFYAQEIDRRINSFASRLADKKLDGALEKEMERARHYLQKESDDNGPQN